MIPVAAWVVFIVFIVGVLALDLGAFQRRSRELSTTESVMWTLVWVALGLAFTPIVYWLYQRSHIEGGETLTGATGSAQYLTAWLVEKSLSLDNIFVFALIFQFFHIPRRLQHRVLFWGIFGALILRGVMIAFGAALIARYSFMHYVFGALLLYAAAKMLFFKAETFDPQGNWLLRLARKIYPVSNYLDGERFFTQLADGRRAITPLLIVLLVVESSDILFAIDSIPACFGVTREPFIVFTSNIFAILGLRSLYFVLAAMMERFHYLKYSLVLILLFIAMKMLLEAVVSISTGFSLIVIVALLAIGLSVSLYLPPPVDHEPRGPREE